MATTKESTTPDVVTTTENIETAADNTVPAFPQGDDKKTSFTLSGGTKVTAEKRVIDTLKGT